MKKIFCFLLLMPLCFLLKAQQKDYDTVALMILDRMSDVIGDLSSCSYVLNTATDRLDNGSLTTAYSRDEVYMMGPDKMLVNAYGEKGHRSFFYNGTTMNYYSFKENNYATVDAPPTIIEAIDSLSATYGIDFPAADFFYPTFTDDLLGYCDKIDYLGLAEVDGKECFHILAKGKNINIQVWVTNDATTLPQKLLINYTGSKTTQRYEAGFSAWQLNPVLPAAMFDFLPPPNANAVYLMPKTSK